MNPKDQKHASQLADITSLLFTNCQAKELQHAEKYKVSIMQFRCLRILHSFKTLTVNQLANEMHLTSGRITRIVDGLVKKRLVHRNIDEHDRRYFHLTLTPEGKKLTSEMIDDYHNIHREIIANVPDESRATLIEMLTILNTAVEDWLCHGSATDLSYANDDNYKI
ncbi:MAG: MarR family transcriptional regulator [candidate division KSB1 bacterium]|jgi:MarR family 2-MHQ and catechol resistance regulon transcriptional repressor|nr:MarR family transcriptional regulator [candidate division KSB1 bacterium]